MKDLKFLILGTSGSGKDHVAKFIESMGYEYINISMIYASVVMDSPKFKGVYETIEECFNDRHNNMVDWFNIIKEHNQKSETMPHTQLYNENVDVLVGIRDTNELLRVLNDFDYANQKLIVLWVRGEGVSQQSLDSMNVTSRYAHFNVVNDLKTDRFKSDIVEIINQCKDVDDDSLVDLVNHYLSNLGRGVNTPTYKPYISSLLELPNSAELTLVNIYANDVLTGEIGNTEEVLRLNKYILNHFKNVASSSVSLVYQLNRSPNLFLDLLLSNSIRGKSLLSTEGFGDNEKQVMGNCRLVLKYNQVV